MKKAFFTFTLALALWPAALMAQSYSIVRDVGADAAEARLNGDGYPYTVMNRPLLEPQERRKLKRNLIKYEQYQRAREASIERQFRAMSPDERRYVIEHYGFPRAVAPGFK